MIQINQNVMQVLSGATIDGARLVLNGALDRKLYSDVNKVIEAAGGKWSRKYGAHIFEGNAGDAIEPILLTGTYTNMKQDFGQFDTPEELAADVVRLAKIEAGLAVLEPSFGIGNLAIACEVEGATLFGFEIDPVRFEKGRSRCVFEGGAFNDDFLKSPSFADFDRVVMNPPFARQADIDHVLHAHRFLRRDGLLVAIMSASVTFRSDRKTEAFRAFIDNRGGEIEMLSDGSFAASGTQVRTCVVTIPA